ncbi:MAG TPA: diguanylate cyclase [Methyloceanibacter sp.]|nr:diguanylate cyclase [Methyloceanibacter sp.]
MPRVHVVFLARGSYPRAGKGRDGVHCSPARSLAEQIAQIFAEAKKNDTSFAFLTVDLDHFKEANDLFGHVIGDELPLRGA